MKSKYFDSQLLKQLIEIPGTSGDEEKIKEFLLKYIEQNKSTWKSEVQIFAGDEFQDAIILVFGKPKVAIFAHIDTIGFTTGYSNNLIPIGSPSLIDGTILVGEDNRGEIETELMIIEQEDTSMQLRYVFNREIDRGTNLTFQPNFILNERFVQSPYLDNRLGVLNALKIAENIENGAIVFSTYEEHGGGSAGFLACFLYNKYKIQQALISDVTWVTSGIHHDGGVVISMRDKSIPRRSFLNKIIAIAEKYQIKYQLEVESAGGSDGTMLQKSDVPFDWCFIGVPEDNVHTPKEKVYLNDFEEMVKFYKILMKELND